MIAMIASAPGSARGALARLALIACLIIGHAIAVPADNPRASAFEGTLEPAADIRRDPAVPELDPAWVAPPYPAFWRDSDRSRSIVDGYYARWARDAEAADGGGVCAAVGWARAPAAPGAPAVSPGFDRIRDYRAYRGVVRTAAEMYAVGPSLIGGLFAPEAMSRRGDTVLLSWFAPSCGSLTGRKGSAFEYVIDVVAIPRLRRP